MFRGVSKRYDVGARNISVNSFIDKDYTGLRAERFITPATR